MKDEIKNHALYKAVEWMTPSLVRAIAKRIYYNIYRFYNRCRYIKKGRFVEFGPGFRLDRSTPYLVRIGERTNTDRFNVWNADFGDIKVGSKCWFGLNNVVMGPVEIGDESTFGPYVKIIGPRHPVLDSGQEKRDKTIIGKKVWVSTGSVILFGVKIGDNAVVSAGSVVTKDVPEGAFVGGNPARNLSALVKKAWGQSEK